MAKVVPVVLSGGTGSRLWPLSREAYPKQLLPLVGSESMLQQVARRASDPARFEPLLVLANAEHRFVIAEQLRTIGLQGRVVLEPEGRNTAPAVAVAALIAARENSDALILIMPADHVIGDEPAFQRAVDAGIPAAERGSLVLFGVRPDRPETGYGYIRIGEPIEQAPGAHRVLTFAEKPDAATAEGYLAAGDYVWNSGIFLLPARAVLGELERFSPEVLRACEQALAEATSDLDFLRLAPEAFRAAPSISLDYAVMEGTECGR